MTGFPEDVTWIENITTNVTFPNSTFSNRPVGIMMVVRLIMSSVGIIGNFTVIVVFLSHRKFRKKIPNIFIVNQVSEKIIENLTSRCFRCLIKTNFRDDRVFFHHTNMNHA